MGQCSKMTPEQRRSVRRSIVLLRGHPIRRRERVAEAYDVFGSARVRQRVEACINRLIASAPSLYVRRPQRKVDLL
jgi:hypothetical protein